MTSGGGSSSAPKHNGSVTRPLNSRPGRHVPEFLRVHMGPDQPAAGLGDGLMIASLPNQAIDVLVSTAGTSANRAHYTRQAAERLAAGEMWQEHDLVFCREDGTPLDRWHVRKEFQKITKAARLCGAWTPRELRHSFVSILSAHDVRLEDISDLVGHISHRDALPSRDPARPHR